MIDTTTAFEQLTAQLRATFTERTEIIPPDEKAYFKLKIDGAYLYSLLFSDLSAEEQQTLDCSTCRRFITYWGGLAIITSEGELEPVIWPSTLEGKAARYQSGLEKVLRYLSTCQVKGLWLESDTQLKAATVPFAGGYNHLNLTDLNLRLSATSNERVTKKHHDHQCKVEALRDNYLRYYDKDPSVPESSSVLATAAELLKHHRPARWKAFVASIDGHLTLQERFKVPAQKRERLIHYTAAKNRYVVRMNGNVLGEVLDALKDNRGTAEALRRYNKYTDSAFYQRPTRWKAFESVNHSEIDRANQKISELGLAKSLERREAEMFDVTQHLEWAPKEPTTETGDAKGFFDVLKEKPVPTDMGLSKIDFNTFIEIVKEKAETLKLKQVVLPEGGFLTAAYPDAPPVLFYDTPEDRNPVSWYVYHDTRPLQYTNGRTIAGITKLPIEWSGRDKFSGWVFIDTDSKDYPVNTSSCLFPELLTPELYDIRSVVEHYSNVTPPKRVDRAIHGFFLFDEVKADSSLFRAEVTYEGKVYRYEVYKQV